MVVVVQVMNQVRDDVLAHGQHGLVGGVLMHGERHDSRLIGVLVHVLTVLFVGCHDWIVTDLEVGEGIEPYQQRSSTVYRDYKAPLHPMLPTIENDVVPSGGFEPPPDWLRTGF